jgi:hypothetical protein
MSEIPLDQDMTVIFNGLQALDDHFKSKGKRFVFAYYLADDRTKTCEVGILPRKIKVQDVTDAYIRWGAIVNNIITPNQFFNESDYRTE